MKLKSILSLALLFAFSASFSQTSNLRKAKTGYEKYVDVKSIGNPALGLNDLKSALAAAEKATEHEKTKDLAESWIYLSLINSELAILDTTANSKEFFKKSLGAFNKAKELDKNNEQTTTIEAANANFAQYELNVGVTAWGKQDFASAYTAFDRGSHYLPKDTVLLYYAGIAAVQSEQYNKALDKYLQLVPVEDHSEHRQIVLDVSRLYMMKEDTVNAIKYAKIGTEKYPEDGEMATQYIELNLMSGNETGVINDINEQAKRYPENKNLQYYLGIAYSATKDNENAKAAYQKALAIDPNYVDANINMGGLLLNEGIDLWNETNNKTGISQQVYDDEIKKAHVIFDKAMPYLQKAIELEGDNVIALENILKYYQIKENNEKIAEIKAKLDSLNR